MKKTIFTVILALGLFVWSAPVLAFPTLVPPECAGDAKLKDCSHCGLDVPTDQRASQNCCCDLSSVEVLAVNVTQIVLGVSGSLALLTFVIAGILYMTSGGEPGKVQKATTMLKTAVIGLAIILLSGLLVQLLLRKLTGT